MKASLHKSGVWRYAWVQSDANQELVDFVVQQAGDRVVDRWQRPQPVAGGPLIVGYRIFTTGDDIREAEDNPKVTKKVVWLPSPAAGETAILTILFMAATGQEIEIRNGAPVAAFSLRSGDGALVVASRRPTTPEEYEFLRAARMKIDEARSAAGAALRNAKEPRAILNGSQENGDRFVFDLAT